VVKVVTNNNRHRYEALLDGMFRDRKRVFVDWLKWDVPVVDGVYEKDQFDTNDAIYLIMSDPETGKHQASVRFLPSTVPHLLKDVFPSFCEAQIPIADDIWEASRLITAPGVKGEVARNVRRQLFTAVMEFALLYGISRITMITHMDYAQHFMASGWEIRPLGLPAEYKGQMLNALEIAVTPTSLQQMRALFGNGSRVPVLEIEGVAQVA
jgi:acyl-homoserine lactone synthase